MTYFGGINDLGVIFEYNIATNTLTNKVDFNFNKGASPDGSLMQASNGKLYGMTNGGGVNGGFGGYGVLFQYDPVTSTYTKKLDFVYNPDWQ